MRLSSWLALGALVGRETCSGERNWKDAILAAVIAKNEILDKDGIARKLIKSGASEGEIEELNQMLSSAMLENKQIQSLPRGERPAKQRGVWAAFCRGFKGA
jgi:hypothetical protein